MSNILVTIPNILHFTVQSRIDVKKLLKLIYHKGELFHTTSPHQHLKNIGKRLCIVGDKYTFQSVINNLSKTITQHSLVTSTYKQIDHCAVFTTFPYQHRFSYTPSACQHRHLRMILKSDFTPPLQLHQFRFSVVEPHTLSFYFKIQL